MHSRIHVSGLLVATALMGGAAAEIAAQAVLTAQPQVLTTPVTVLSACYVPATGTIYRVGEAGIPGQCANPSHIAFSWNAEGVQGPPGLTGLIGPQGEPGVAGAEGPRGIDGVDGSGIVGAQGPVGLKGDTGVAGPIGPQGVAGAPGPDGVQGLPGVKGDSGVAGPQGAAGGIGGLEIVSATHPYNASLTHASLDCPAGKVAIAGGYDLLVPWADSHGPRVVMSRRDPLNVQRWLWIVADDMHMSPDFHLEVICVTGS